MILADEELQEALKEYLGIGYRTAGASKKGFDCSGFVKVCYKRFFGTDLPHQSSEQAFFPEMKEVPRDDLRTGDLVFFSIGHERKAINHVGIYLSEGEFIHAARSKGIVISRLEARYWRTQLICAKRLTRINELHEQKTVTDLSVVDQQQNQVFFKGKRKNIFFMPLISGLYPDHFYLSEGFKHLGFKGTNTSGSLP